MIQTTNNIKSNNNQQCPAYQTNLIQYVKFRQQIINKFISVQFLGAANPMVFS